MRRALALAKRGQGRVEPNPMVGCVIVKASRIVAEGYHKRFGGPHAEVDALRSDPSKGRGATAYVTLEPCNHYGKTPPCTELLISAGIKRVVAAMTDPGEHVRGRGFRRLRSAGVSVQSGCLEAESKAMNAPYLALTGRGRPYVLLKWAQSLDGQLATPPGSPRQISGPAAHRWMHKLRARVDGVIVGVKTAMTDDPQLTARDVPIRRVASRIVLDSSLRISLRSNLVRTAGVTPTIVMTTRGGVNERPSHAERLRRAGVRIEVCRTRGGHVDLADALARLGAMQMSNVMVEGGARVLQAFLTSHLADEAHFFVAPILLGDGHGPVAFDRKLAGEATVRSRSMSPDVLYSVKFNVTDSGSGKRPT
jgi:diaminohydroxyphosphoribosylaminopyrimidine deaminase / 5-amino-6-(5-phosphoribosylamino)uracil reductase